VSWSANRALLMVQLNLLVSCHSVRGLYCANVVVSPRFYQVTALTKWQVFSRNAPFVGGRWLNPSASLELHSLRFGKTQTP
jgi:hypothetical protein